MPGRATACDGPRPSPRPGARLRSSRSTPMRATRLREEQCRAEEDDRREHEIGEEHGDRDRVVGLRAQQALEQDAREVEEDDERRRGRRGRGVVGPRGRERATERGQRPAALGDDRRDDVADEREPARARRGRTPAAGAGDEREDDAAEDERQRPRCTRAGPRVAIMTATMNAHREHGRHRGEDDRAARASPSPCASRSAADTGPISWSAIASGSPSGRASRMRLP